MMKVIIMSNKVCLFILATILGTIQCSNKESASKNLDVATPHLQASQGSIVVVHFVERPAKAPQPLSEGCIVNDDFAWVIDAGELIRTVDGGQSWQRLAPSPKDEPIFGKIADTAIRVYFVTPTRGWLATSKGTWQTEDGGLIWQRLFNNAYASLQFADTQNGWINILTDRREQNHITHNGGLKWQPCEITPESKAQMTGSAFFLTPQLGWAISSQKIGRASLYGVARTTDGGCHWQQSWISEKNPDERYGSIYFLNENEGWIAGSYLGSLSHTTNGGVSWKELPVPDTDLQIASVYFSSPTVGWIITATHSNDDTGLFHTTDSGRHWRQLTKQEVIKGIGLSFTRKGTQIEWKPGRLLQMLYVSNK